MAWENKVAQREAVKSFEVLVDGKIDLEQSCAKYRAACLQHKARVEAEDTLISECMGDLFDTYRGANLGLEYVKSQCVQRMVRKVPELNVPALHSTLAGRVEDYLQENCDQAEVPAKGDKPAVPAITDRLYGKKMGKGGGFFRKSDKTA